MKKAGIRFITALTVAAQLLCLFISFPTVKANADPPIFEKTFSQRFSEIAIENPNGRTVVETWNSNRVRITASRGSGTSVAAPLESRLRFQVTDTDLRVSVRGERIDGSVNLLVYVPRQVNLAVRSETEAVAIKGMTSSLSVETESGQISLSVPQNSSADLSLRSIEGTISSELEMRVFGPVNPHSLDGRIGRGGVPVILRSLRGAVLLLPDEPGRIARTDSKITSDANSLREPQSIASASFTNTSSTYDAPTPQIVSVDATSDPPVADVIKIDSRLVNLNVRVTDASGKLIPDLTKADFQIFEDNVKQELVRFEPVTTPVSVILLLDASGSTKERWKVIRKAAKTFIDTLSPNTRVAVAAFTRRFLMICDFNCDRKLMKERIDDTKNLQSGTAFYDAMWAAMNLFKEINEQRKAIVVLTDGVDNSISSEDYEPRHPFDELVARINQEEVTIYPIYFDTEFQVVVKDRGSDTHESYATARKQLHQIADDTGGTLFRADKAEDLDGVYERVANELQALYSVSYNPADKNYDGKWRTVGVKINRASAQARTKRGFYAR
jgi:VWFA-related protein